jgi:hypothetical protein
MARLLKLTQLGRIDSNCSTAKLTFEALPFDSLFLKVWTVNVICLKDKWNFSQRVFAFYADPTSCAYIARQII